MISTRFVGLGPSFRSAALQPRFALRNQAALRTVVLRRSVQTQVMKPEQTMEILNAQRIRRPSSPHFTIYQPQLTWIGSIFNRVTGSALSVLLYGFSLSYFLFPYAGLPFNGADVVEFISTLPDAAKYSGKALLALPFSFHFWNGLRHLAWDSGKFLSLKGAYSSGYAVLGATTVSTVALLFV